jgi:Uma2 family endonuclease
MTVAPRWIEGPESPAILDQRLLLHGVSWGRYCVMRELLDSSAVRFAYLEGALEIMSPSPRHEFLKKQIARLLELFSLERGVPLIGYGSTTFRREAKERGVEPDECYCVGRELGEGPDIAIEVVLLNWTINKLSIYAGLGVGEVWLWREDAFEIYRLEGDRYRALEPADRSTFIPELDFAVLADFVRRPDQYAAVLAFRDLLAGQPRS